MVSLRYCSRACTPSYEHSSGKCALCGQCSGCAPCSSLAFTKLVRFKRYPSRKPDIGHVCHIVPCLGIRGILWLIDEEHINLVEHFLHELAHKALIKQKLFPICSTMCPPHRHHVSPNTPTTSTTSTTPYRGALPRL